MPLFRLPKSLDGLIPVYLHCLMTGSSQQREAAANAIGELAAMADPAVLKGVLIKTTGPLIRVVGDRFPSPVKAAILDVRHPCSDADDDGYDDYNDIMVHVWMSDFGNPIGQRRSVTQGICSSASDNICKSPK